MKRHTKKVVGLALAVIMVFAMALTVSAATITIDKGASGSEYAAYKLLNATDGGNGKYAYTLNEAYEEILKGITGQETEAEIIQYISGLSENAGVDAVRAFADAVYAAVKDMTPDYTTSTDKFENVDQGYYLIAETKTGNTQDTYSLVMLDTAGKNEVTIETKEDTPELEKKVQEKNDSDGTVSDWQDGADYDINDEVPFKLTGTVSDKYDEYEKYYYAFHDKMSDGLTFNEDSVVVRVDGTVVTGGYEVVYPATDGHTFDVVFEDLKKITGATVNKDSKITVEFNATLNEDAVIGNPGNPNEANLEYSNNPYDEGEGKPETGITPDDKVVVFTYKLIANKVDGKGEALEGAGFTLYKFDKEADDWVKVGDEITGVTSFTFTGLDAGEYKLVETKVPDGYNKADDIYFTIEATYDTNADDPGLLTLVVKDADGNVISEGEGAVFSTSITDGSVNTSVVNKAGTELPSTGGMGTTIFYIVGASLMLVAAVLLITRKKMSKHNN